MAHYITEACIGCTMCSRNCPVWAIQGKLKEQHSINKKRCVDCGVCGKVCPKGAVIDGNGKSIEKVPKAQWLKPSVDVEQCSACSMCVDICSFDCLQITQPQFKGDLNVHAQLTNPQNCVGCVLCAKICPLHAITMEGGE